MAMTSLWLTLALVMTAIAASAAADADPLQDFCVADLSNSHTTINGLPCKPAAHVTATDFKASLFTKAGNTNNVNKIAVTTAFVADFPALNTLGISAVRIDIAPGGINPPHTHPRSSELILVVKGQIYAGFVDTNNKLFATVLKAGELIVVPPGLVHFLLNVGSGNAMAFAGFNSQNPGVQVLPSALFGSGIKDEVLVKGFRVSEHTVNMIEKEFQS